MTRRLNCGDLLFRVPRLMHSNGLLKHFSLRLHKIVEHFNIDEYLSFLFFVVHMCLRNLAGRWENHGNP